MLPTQLLFLVLATLEHALAANTCAKKYPIYVDIHNRTVIGGTERFQWGSFIGTGVPSQNQSLWVSLSRNETSFAARGFCDNSTLADCLNNSGGTVDFTRSTAWKEDDSYQTKDASSIATTSVRGRDDVHLFSHYFDPSPASVTNVTNMPIEYALGGDKNPAVVGLGSASTIMQSLLEQGHVGDKVYSLYLGNSMERGAGNINGSHTFGGYDAARMTGPVYTYDMDLSQADYLPVTVEDILLDDPSSSQGRNKSLLDNGRSFEARITTDQYPMLLPAKVTQNFKDALQATNSSNPDGSLQLPNSFNGTLTIKLNNGFNITLPAETIANISNITPIQDNTDEDYTGPFYLSTAFLTQVYLTLDYHAKKFHMAQVVQRTPKGVIIPIQLCSGDVPVPHLIGTATSKFMRDGLIGAVIGGLFGGIALIIASLWAYVAWRRHQYAKVQDSKWADDKKYRDSGSSEEVEMQNLSPVEGRRKFLWTKKEKLGIGKGKGRFQGVLQEDTGYRGKNLSEESL